MTDQQSLDEIAKLLLKYPGITSAVVFQVPDRPEVHVRFRCVDANSLTAIARCTVRANVSIELGDPDSGICAEQDKSRDLPCDITIPDEEAMDGEETPTQPQLFGVFLADDLERKGLISTDDMSRLHSGWNTQLKVRPREQ